MRNLILFTSLLMLGTSCTKPSDPISPQIPIPPPAAFKVTVDFRNENTAGIRWTDASPSLLDTIHYTVILQGTTKNANLFRFTDTLLALKPDSVYTGKVIATNQRGDTSSAGFSLPAFQGYAYVFSTLTDNSFSRVNIATWKPIWTVPGVYGGRRGPCTNGDTLFITNDKGGQNLTAVNKKDGSAFWSVPLPGPGSQYSGIEMSIDNGRLIYRVDEALPVSTVCAVSSSNGKLLWSTPMPPAQSPLLAFNNRIYYGGNDKYMYAVDAVSGKLVWKYLSTDAISFNCPTVVANTLCFAVNEGRMFGLDLDGHLKWQAANAGLDGNNVNLGFVDDGKNIFYSAGDATINSRDAATGKLNWSQGGSHGDLMDPPKRDGNTIYAVSSAVSPNTKLMAIDRASGTLRYYTNFDHPTFLPVSRFYVPVNNRIYYISGKEFVIADATAPSEITYFYDYHFQYLENLVIEINNVVYK